MSRTAINDRARAGRSSGGVPLEPDGVATDGTEGGPPRRNARAVAPPERPAPFRRAVRFTLLAPALALALGGVLLGSVPAEAQTATVLVKNTGQTGASGTTSLTGPTPKRAQAFTTGSNATGYTLASIGVEFAVIDDVSAAASRLTVTLNGVSGSDPGDVVCTLAHPATYVDSGVNTYGASGCPTLDANTKYFLVLERTDLAPSDATTSAIELATTELAITSSTSEDSGAADGWSIANSRHYFATGSWATISASAYLIEVKGVAIVPPKRVTGFTLHSDNHNPKGIWGNDETIWVAQNGTDKLFAYNRSDGSRDSSEDFNTIAGAGNGAPTGLCSDGTTMFVVDWADNKVYAYDLATKAHDSTKDITLAGGNTKPEGVWCDDDTVWVVEDDFTGSNDIFAYNRADGTQNTDVDFPTLDPTVDGSPLNANPRGIWSDGTTMFVVDDEDATVYAWKMSDQTRDSAKEIALDSDNADPEGLWFDGRVLWVIDNSDDKVYAYDLPGAQPGNTIAYSDPEIRTPTTEDVWTATLTAATNALGVGYITDLNPDVGSLSPGATFTVDEVTYTVKSLYDRSITANEGSLVLVVDKELPRGFKFSVPGGSFSSSSSFRDPDVNGFRYTWPDAALSWSASDTISVVLSVDSVPEQGVEVTADVSGITDRTDGLANAFFHYQWIQVDGTAEVELDGETGSTYTPTADDVGKHLKVRVIFDDDAGNKEYPRTSRQVGPVVAKLPDVTVSFGQAVYVVAEGSNTTVRVKLSEDPKRQVVVPLTAANEGTASNSDYSGVPESVTFASGETEKSFTFSATDDTVDDDDESVGLAFGELPAGVTEGATDAATVFIIDDDDPAPTATVLVKNTGQTDAGIIGFGQGTLKRAQAFTTGSNENGYSMTSIGVEFGLLGNVATVRSQLTVTLNEVSGSNPGDVVCTLAHPATYVTNALNTYDASGCPTLRPNTSYFLVLDRTSGTSNIQLDRTASSSEDSGAADGWSIANRRHYFNAGSWTTVAGQAHMIEVKGAEIVPPPRVTGFDLHSANSNPRGVWGDDETIWVANDGTAAGNKIFAYKRADGSRDSAKEFDTLNDAGNQHVRGICSDGTTMFVADDGDNHVYAYKMSDRTRDADKDITLTTGNTVSRGVWCDADTVWVANDSVGTNKIFAYKRSDGSHDSAKDMESLDVSTVANSANAETPRGLWSDGTTMFVADSEDDKVFAYKLSDETQDSDKNILLDSDNTDAWGLWFDGRVLWVADSTDDKLYAYDLPGAQSANTPAVGLPEIRTHTTEDVWTATLTVGQLLGHPGYGTVDFLGTVFGSFSPAATFTLDGVTYTVVFAIGTVGNFHIGLDNELPREFAFSVAGESYSSANASRSTAQGRYQYLWTGAGLSWSVSDSIPVVLSVESVPREGVEVTADVSGITDSTDGLAGAFFHYQWLRVDGTAEVELDGETGSTYTPIADDVGKHLKVRVVFDDDAGYLEYPRTSGQVGPVVAKLPDVGFEQGSYSVAEGASVTVKVQLSAALGGEVVVPLTATTEGGAGVSDYSGVPASVTFASGETEKSFMFSATDDTVDDDDESVGLAFGELPAGVTEGATDAATVFIIDDDDPAQTATTLVSNTGQSVQTGTHILNSSFPRRAQAFTTGDATDGYALSSIGVRFGTIDSTSTAGADLTVTLNTDDSGNPGDALCTLDDPASFTSGAVNTFDAPASGTDRCPRLAASTTYFVVVTRVAFSVSNTIYLSTASSGIDDTGGAAGWSIGNQRHYRSGTVWRSFSPPYLIEVTGAAIVLPPRVTGFDLHSDNDNPKGIWGNDETIWVANDRGGNTGNKIFAYKRADGSRDSGKDFDSLLSAGNEDIRGICSDGTTMFVADRFDDKVYAYKMSDRTRDSAKDITFDSDNGFGTGVWCDADTVWVANDGTGAGNKIFAYKRSDGSHDSAKDMESLYDSTAAASDNATEPRGLWSDGTTMFVTDSEDDKVYAFKLSDESQDSDKNIPLDSDNDDARGLWFDGRVLWVVDATDDRLYAYDLPGAQPGNTVAVGNPVLGSVARVGVEVTADVSGITDGTDGLTTALFHYQWIRVDGTAETELDGETGATYTPTAADVGKHLKVRVIFDDDAGNREYPRTSRQVGPVVGHPEVTVSFEQGSYAVAEGASVTVRVQLNDDPKREVVVPLTATFEGGASLSDFSGVPLSVTFASGETEKSFRFSATQDTVDDDGESVSLGFRTLPAGVTPGTVDEATVSITDDDDPEVTVSFEQGSYSVAEGASVTVRVQLNDDPEREVVVPLTATTAGGASVSDFSGVPASMTFASGETVKSFRFSATQDTVDDDGESVTLRLGTLPVGVTPGTVDEVIVSITDDDDPVEVTVGFEQGSYSVAEGATVIVRVQLSANAGREVVVPLTVTNLGGAGSSDYHAVPASVGIAKGSTQVSFAFSATDDTVDDDGESVRLGFGTLPTGVTAGATDEATVSITDDDDPEVTTVLVSNTGQTVTGGPSLSSGSQKRAQAFTTGSNVGGYTLTSIGVEFALIGDVSTVGSSLAATINEVSGSDPGDVVCTLAHPATYVASALNTYDASGCPALDANTSYFLVLERTGSSTSLIRIDTTTSTSEDSGAADGWSIANVRHHVSGGSWTTSSGQAHLIEVKGVAIVPPPRVTGFALDSANADPEGVWGNDETIWVANDGRGIGNKIFAYKRADGSRDSAKDFDSLNAAGNQYPRGICSDGTTMFVSDSNDNQVYAYKMSDRTRDSAKDIALTTTATPSNVLPTGVWCDADTVWVANDGSAAGNKIFAYKRSDGTHDSAKDMESLYVSTAAASDNAETPRGLWSNGTTMFVTDIEDDKVYAYKLSDESQDSAKNILLDSDNDNARGLWFDGRVLWVVDSTDDRLYVYHLRGAQPDNTTEFGDPAVRTPTSEDVWTATLTPGGTLGVGYSTLSGFEGGSLSPGATFAVGGVTYTVLDFFQACCGPVRLWLSLEEPLPRSFTFSVFPSYSSVGVSYSSGGASQGRHPNTDRYDYIWKQSNNLLWTNSDTILVVLSVDSLLEQGVELTADVSGIIDDDGLTTAYFHYQWIRVDGTTETELDGETDATYTPTADDVGKHLKVRVIFDDDGGNKEYPRTSRQVGPVVSNSPATGAPSISGTVQAGELLSADTSAVADPNGVTNVAYSYQWLRSDGNSDTEITGAVGPQYIPSDADVGKMLKVRVDFEDDSGYAEQLTSAATTSSVTAAASGSVVWSATLKVGSLAGSGTTSLGYLPGGFQGFTHDGALTPDGFIRNGVMYTFHRMLGGDQAEDPSRVTIGPNLTRDDMESWTLIFAEDEFRLSDSLSIVRDEAEGRDGYILHRTGLSWSDGDYVAVALNIGTVVNNPRLDLVLDNVSQGGRFLTVKPHSTNTTDIGYGPDHGYTGSSSSLRATSAFFTGQTHGTTRYGYWYRIVAVRSDGSLVLRLEVNTRPGSALPVPATSHLKLAVDGEEFDLGDATLTQTTGSDGLANLEFVWPNSGLTWVDDQQVVVFMLADDNQTPTVSVTADPGAVSGNNQVALDGTATDLDGDGLSYVWSSDGGGTFADGSALDTTWTAPSATQADRVVTLTLTVTDDGDGFLSATAEVQVTVLANQAPTVSAIATPGAVGGGNIVALDGTATDPEGDGLSFVWSSDGGGTFADDSALDTTWTAPAATQTEQVVNLTLTVTDDGDGFLSATAEVQVTVLTSANQAPSVSATATPGTVGGGGTVTLDGTAVDPEGDGLSYAWSSNGGGTFLDDSALDTTWTAPAATQTEQVVNLTLTVTDDGGGGSATAQVEVTVLASANQAPSVSAIATPGRVGGGGTVALDGTATDPEGDGLSYAWSSDGGGAFADDSALDTTWTAPAATQTEQVVNLTLTVTDDGGGGSATAQVEVTVLASANQAPTVSATATPATVGGGGTVTMDGTATDPEGDGLSYVWSSDGGGTFADDSALDTTWTAPAATQTEQVVTLTLTVTDDGGSSASVTVSVVVEPAAPAAPAGVTLTPSSLNLTEGGSGSYEVALDGEPAGDVTITITAGGSVTTDPTRLTFTASTWNTAQTVTVRAAHDSDTRSEDVTITHAIAPGSAPGYLALTNIGEVYVFVADDDQPGVQVSPVQMTVAEGSTATYTVVLAVEPSANVRISLRPQSVGITGRSVLLDTYSLEFTTADWNIPQTVTIDAIHDGDGNDDVVPIRHRVASGSAGEYRNLSVDTLSVTITDADPEPAAVLSIRANGSRVSEGSSFVVTVTMSAAHTEDVNVRVGLDYAEGLVTGTGQNKPVKVLPPYGPGGTPWATASTHVDLLFQAGDTSKSFTVSVADDSVRSPAGSRRIIVGLMGANTTEVIKGTRTVVYVHAVEDD